MGLDYLVMIITVLLYISEPEERKIKRIQKVRRDALVFKNADRNFFSARRIFQLMKL